MTRDLPDLHTTCCIAGGGPAGLMLGYLLARAGVEVVVLEKHADFLRDFRGDTIHPSTLELLHELGLLEGLLRLPHTRMHSVHVMFEGRRVAGPDFTHLPTQCNFVAFIPQWDFLNLVAQEARKLPNFHLLMQAELVDVLCLGDNATSTRASTAKRRVQGVRVRVPNGELRVHANLSIAADGRGSALRAAAGMQPVNLGVPIVATIGSAVSSSARARSNNCRSRDLQRSRRRLPKPIPLPLRGWLRSRVGQMCIC